MADRKTRDILRQDNPFPNFARDARFDKTSAPGDKRVKAPEMLVTFRDDGKQISQVQTTGQSLLEEFPLRPERDKTNLMANAFHLIFAPDSDRIEKFTADDRVRVDVIAPAPPVKTSTSDHLKRSSIQTLANLATAPVWELWLQRSRSGGSCGRGSLFCGNTAYRVEGQPGCKGCKLANLRRRF
jgi:hypothetical protein